MFRLKIILVLFSFCAIQQIAAQKAERSDIRTGNKFYKKDKFTESEIEYRKSIEVNPRSLEGIYNLGNSLYKQEKFPEAAEQYQLLAGQGERLLHENPKNAQKMAQIFHNMGNVGMKTKEYQKSVDAYKQSLRLNPNDDETRYNLALAQKLLNDQQQQQQDQNKDDNKDQDKQDEQQNKDNKDDQQNKDQQQQQQEDKKQKTQEEKQQQEQMSKDNAQQMLDAFLQDEKDTQEKVKKAKMQQQQSRKREKQW
jgi:tetratricopeptide (TPR) repeat protein